MAGWKWFAGVLVFCFAATWALSCGDDEDNTNLSESPDDEADSSSPMYESKGIVWLSVTPGGGVEIDGTMFNVEPFYIAKHEITNAQYDAFVRSADGFDNPEWWNGMPAEYRPPQRVLPQQQNNLIDAPRDNVTWYQAVAYTRWLNARMVAKKADISLGGVLINGIEWEVRLPTEWEWQWAAQGGMEARAYPWGDWQEGRANIFDEGIGETTTVGLYPLGASVFGALDMSGNVWEWCLNDHSSPYSVDSFSIDSFKEMRGGSFDSSPSLASCLTRTDGWPPDFRLFSIGFRVGLFAPR